eukprot:4535977-Pyramimonas_sp.AAC.1
MICVAAWYETVLRCTVRYCSDYCADLHCTGVLYCTAYRGCEATRGVVIVLLLPPAQSVTSSRVSTRSRNSTAQRRRAQYSNSTAQYSNSTSDDQRRRLRAPTLNYLKGRRIVHRYSNSTAPYSNSTAQPSSVRNGTAQYSNSTAQYSNSTVHSRIDAIPSLLNMTRLSL